MSGASWSVWTASVFASISTSSTEATTRPAARRCSGVTRSPRPSTSTVSSPSREASRSTSSPTGEAASTTRRGGEGLGSRNTSTVPSSCS